MLTKLMERHKVGAAPLKFLASRSVGPSASGHEGLVFQWALYFQGINPRCRWKRWSPTSMHTHPSTCTHMLLDRALAPSPPGVGNGTCNLKYDLTALEMVACGL